MIGFVKDITERKSSEEILKKSEEKFRVIFNSSFDAIFLLNWNDLSIIDVNDEVRNRFGYTREELKRFTIDDLNAGEDDFINNVKSKEEFNKILNREMILKEWLSKTKKGDNIWHEMQIKLVELEGEKLLLAIARDINQKKKAEDEIERMTDEIQKIFDSSPSAIITVDKNGYVTSWSPASEEIFGWRADEVVGKFNPTVPENMREMYLKTIKEKHVNLEIKVLTKDSSLVDISLSTTPLFNDKGQISGALGIMTDISDRKVYEDEINRKIGELEAFQNVAIDREIKMVELKKEINSLCERVGDKPRYIIP